MPDCGMSWEKRIRFGGNAVRDIVGRVWKFVVLGKVLKPRLIGAFIGIVGLGILLVGYLFNIVI
jgi:uncharacterized membrane protein YraQ (UPF0718 family)